MARAFLPIEIKNQMIQVFGRSFWYRQPLFDVLARAGIAEEIYVKYEREYKFTIARKLLADLEQMGDEGLLLQRRLLTEFCKLRRLPDTEVKDREAALDALRILKRLAIEHDLYVEGQKETEKRSAAGAKARVLRTRERANRLGKLSDTFAEMASSNERQARGYELEDLVEELFALFEISYRKAYRTSSEQIDGSFSFGGFDYLVENRWRQERTALADLLAFKGKVDGKIKSTRGLFLSISGFVDGAADNLRATGQANLILMDGYDLTLILEGRVSLIDGLQAKTEKAFQEGVVDFHLAQLFKVENVGAVTNVES